MWEMNIFIFIFIFAQEKVTMSKISILDPAPINIIQISIFLCFDLFELDTKRLTELTVTKQRIAL